VIDVNVIVPGFEVPLIIIIIIIMYHAHALQERRCFHGIGTLLLLA